MRATPPREQCSIALWHGYVAGQFYAQRSAQSDAFRVSESFRTWRLPWKKKHAFRDDPGARGALAALERDLLGKGWRRIPPEDGDAWYELRFRRGTSTPASLELAQSASSGLRQALPANGNGMAATEEILVPGYRAAVDRLLMAIHRRDPPEVAFLPLFEALSWAARIIDSREYDQLEVAQGLRWARNGVHLHWARALESRGAVAPWPVLGEEDTEIVGHTLAIEWFWRPVERMPKPRASKRESEQREAYRTHFAGRKAQEPLCRLLEDVAPSFLARR